MRISAEKNDPGYRQYLVCRENGRLPKIFLDGKEIKDVVTADDEAGFLVRHPTDAAGKLILDETGECLAEEVLKGEVRFEFAADGQTVPD